MPFSAVVRFIPYALEEMRQDELADQRADDDGMPPPYIRLEGIKVPRSLSWAEERALRHDLEQRAWVSWREMAEPHIPNVLTEAWTNSPYGSSGP